MRNTTRRRGDVGEDEIRTTSSLASTINPDDIVFWHAPVSVAETFRIPLAFMSKGTRRRGNAGVLELAEKVSVYRCVGSQPAEAPGAQSGKEGRD